MTKKNLPLKFLINVAKKYQQAYTVKVIKSRGRDTERVSCPVIKYCSRRR
ncbi:hypothetical protein [[Ruminococcus] lactaris]